MGYSHRRLFGSGQVQFANPNVAEGDGIAVLLQEERQLGGMGCHWSVSSGFTPGSDARRGKTGSAERRGIRAAARKAKAKKRSIKTGVILADRKD